MAYAQIKLKTEGRVGIITLFNPPRNGFSKRMVAEVLDAFTHYVDDPQIRTIMLNGEGPDFSRGADESDILAEFSEESNAQEDYSVLGGRLVTTIECCPKATLVAARGQCLGGSTAVFNAFDIRIVSENFSIRDGDIYYGTVGSWGMSSLRLPRWIGRNRIMDYMFLNERFTGRQAYELGIVSKVVPDALLDTVSLQIATMMATAAPIAVRCFKECVRKAITADFDEAREFELKAAETVYATEDCKNGLESVFAISRTPGTPMCEFHGK